jgi:aspartyl-tRNA(Asn)/glutamyl-tRNA(Gln) amidotransferase subunit C
LPSCSGADYKERLMALSKEQVRHVATLARLQLTEVEVEHMVHDLGNILAHVEQLAAVDTSNVEPTRYLAVEQLPLQADAIEPCLSNEAALAPAARTLGGGFAVPAFVDEG